MARASGIKEGRVSRGTDVAKAGVEKSYVDAADGALDTRLDALEAIPPYTDADVFDALTQLPLGSKVTWEYSGGDILELYSERIASGLNLYRIDDANTDNTAQWNQHSSSGSLIWNGTEYRCSAFGDEWWSTSWGAQNDTAKIRQKFRFTHAGNNFGWAGAGFKNLTGTKRMIAQVRDTGVMYVVYGAYGDNNVQDLGVPFTPVAGTSYWIELARSGNNRTVTVYAADGVTVIYTNTAAIKVGETGFVGAGISLFPAFANEVDNSNNRFTWTDQIELYTQQPEIRDILVAVTPAAGTRTIRRLIGSYGSTTLRSDFGLDQFVTSLPSEPYHGQRINFLADATNGVVWQFRYNLLSLSDFKWEFTGGSDMYQAVLTDESTASTAYVGLTTPLTITLPLAGEYDVGVEAAMYNDTAGAYNRMSYAIGATAAVDADSVYTRQPVANYDSTFSSRRRKAILAAGTVLTTKYRCSAGTSHFLNRNIWARPVRVG